MSIVEVCNIYICYTTTSMYLTFISFFLRSKPPEQVGDLIQVILPLQGKESKFEGKV